MIKETLLPKETPHFFMWICNGKEDLPDDQLPLPPYEGKEQFNYLETLKSECAKLAKTKTPAYLVYMGSLLTENQKQKMESLSEEIPNLFMVDYDGDHFPQWCLIGSAGSPEYEIAKGIEQSKQSFVKNRGIKTKEDALDSIGSIANLVDYTRIFLVDRCDMLHEIVRQKYKNSPAKTDLLPKENGVVYRDFDVTLKKDEMEDLPLFCGIMTSTNNDSLHRGKRFQLEEKMKDPILSLLLKELTEHAYKKELKTVEKELSQYYEEVLIKNPERFLRTIKAYNLGDEKIIQAEENKFIESGAYLFEPALYPKIDEVVDQLAKKDPSDNSQQFAEVLKNRFKKTRDYELHGKKISEYGLFQAAFLITDNIYSFGIENSMIAVAQDRMIGFGGKKRNSSNDQIKIDLSPYGALKAILRQTILNLEIDVGENEPQTGRKNMDMALCHFLETSMEHFNVGNDQSWIEKRPKQKTHTREFSRARKEPELKR